MARAPTGLAPVAWLAAGLAIGVRQGSSPRLARSAKPVGALVARLGVVGGIGEVERVQIGAAEVGSGQVDFGAGVALMRRDAGVASCQAIGEAAAVTLARRVLIAGEIRPRAGDETAGAHAVEAGARSATRDGDVLRRADRRRRRRLARPKILLQSGATGPLASEQPNAIACADAGGRCVSTLIVKEIKVDAAGSRGTDE